MAFRLVIPAFPQGGLIPQEYTCEGQNLSPAMDWFDPPHGVQSYALIVDDPDAPGATWNHWLLWNIPASKMGLAKGYTPSEKTEAGTNDFGHTSYGGPCPPLGHGPHRYFFRLYALDAANLPLEKGAPRAMLDHAIHAHLLAVAEYQGRYERRRQ